ncbi:MULTISPECIES: DUF302 domain-containing protein [Sediminimonas]|uniref:DUF302 domain-containing protein n=1 Tax=Sediminimonas TaxID=659427 RepID=UPI000406F70B|nr:MULTISPECIES: DUF302 domain-containing protein [Sediminimonas]MDR9485378.1 DUF302 domain-containing protein [Sediminimonas sp.]
MKRLLTAALTCAAMAAPAAAEEMISYTTDQSYEDVVFGLENAILDEGLVIDSTSHVGAMLERTRADVGSDVVLFEAADVYSFCSAQLSREVMEADPMNIVFCPYDIFVARQPGDDSTMIGYRSFPDGEMQKIQTLLDRIARNAIGME